MILRITDKQTREYLLHRLYFHLNFLKELSPNEKELIQKIWNQLPAHTTDSILEGNARGLLFQKDRKKQDLGWATIKNIQDKVLKKKLLEDVKEHFIRNGIDVQIINKELSKIRPEEGFITINSEEPRNSPPLKKRLLNP